MQYIHRTGFENKEDFENKFQDHDDYWGTSFKAAQKHRIEMDMCFLNEIAPPYDSGETILEIGCGRGDTTEALKKARYDSYVTAVDISETAIDICRKRFSDSSINFVCEKLPNLNLPGQTFDIVLCLSVFSYFDTELKEASLKEMMRLAKPNGWLFIETNIGNSPEIIKEMQDIVLRYFTCPVIKFNYAKLYSYLDRILSAIYRRLDKNRQLGLIGIPFGYIAYLLLRSRLIMNIFYIINKTFFKNRISHILIGCDMKKLAEI